mmetsp:Transcript_4267/g.12039  ORF Transcript_4267/g.12039 Transcript_4267/m.12039 type:complete len:480 (-) Transcript_4267:132-1571(-)
MARGGSAATAGVLLHFTALWMILGSSEAVSATEKLKAGDSAVAAGHNLAAIRHYTDALDLDPKSSLIFTKRAAAYVNLKKMREAIKDLTQALEIEPRMTQALLTRGKVYRALGSFDKSRADFEGVLAIKENHKTASQELGMLFKAKDAFEAAKRQLGINDIHGAHLKLQTAVSLLPDFPGVMMLQAQLLEKQGDNDRLVAELGKLLKIEPGNIEAMIMRGWAYMRLGDQETGLRHFREVLRFDPEHKAAKEAHKKIKSIGKLKDQAHEAMQKRDNRGAEAAFIKAVQVEPTLWELNLPMFRELCQLQTQMGKAKEALESCDTALRSGELVDVAINKVKALLKLERYEEAAALARGLMQSNRGNGQVHQILQEAERLLKMSKRKDYYKILQVDRRADEPTIKRQYRKLAKLYHPDKAQGTDEEKAEAEKKFRDVAEAYEVLTDPEKRSRFDRGEDMDQPGGGHPGGPQFHQGGQRFNFRF